MKRPRYGKLPGRPGEAREGGIKIVRCPRCRWYAWLPVWAAGGLWWAFCPSCGIVRLW